MLPIKEPQVPFASQDPEIQEIQATEIITNSVPGNGNSMPCNALIFWFWREDRMKCKRELQNTTAKS